MIRAATILALSLLVFSSCAKTTQQNQTSANEQPAPKKAFYFVRKIDGKVSPLPPDLGEFTNAQRVEGKIIGNIVQRSSATQEKTKDGKYIYTYFVTDGKNIELIDNAGLYHALGGKVSLLVANIDKPDVPDLEFLQAGMDPKAGGIIKLPSGGTMTHFTYEPKKQAPGALRLLGEFRFEPGKSQLIPTLHVETDSGPVDIPLDQLVPFKKKIEQPSPAK